MTCVVLPTDQKQMDSNIKQKGNESPSKTQNNVKKGEENSLDEVAKKLKQVNLNNSADNNSKVESKNVQNPRATSNTSSSSRGSGEEQAGLDNQQQQNQELIKDELYKTELCKKFMQTGICRYSNKCRFAHGYDELRNLVRHPLYKTSLCKSFQAQGSCRYGSRCRFIHNEEKDYLQAVPRGMASTSPSGNNSGAMSRVPSAPANLNSLTDQTGPYGSQFISNGMKNFVVNNVAASTALGGSTNSGGSQPGDSDSTLPLRVQLLQQQAAQQQDLIAQQQQRLMELQQKQTMQVRPPVYGNNSNDNRGFNSGINSNYGRLGGLNPSASAADLSAYNRPGLGFPPTYEDFLVERRTHEKEIDEDDLFATSRLDASKMPVASSNKSGDNTSLDESPQTRLVHKSTSDVELHESASSVAFQTLLSQDDIRRREKNLNDYGVGRGGGSELDMSRIALPPRRLGGDLHNHQDNFMEGSISRSASQPVFNQSQPMFNQQNQPMASLRGMGGDYGNFNSNGNHFNSSANISDQTAQQQQHQLSLLKRRQELYAQQQKALEEQIKLEEQLNRQQQHYNQIYSSPMNGGGRSNADFHNSYDISNDPIRKAASFNDMASNRFLSMNSQNNNSFSFLNTSMAEETIENQEKQQEHHNEGLFY